MCKPLRVFIALFLCCTLLFINGPVRAHAAGFTPGLYALDATNLLIGGARALGIGPGDDPLDFSNLITDAKNALFSGTSPLVNVWLDYAENGFRAFLSAEFLADLLSFFFHSGALVRNTATSAPSSSKYYYLSDAVALARTYPYAYFLTPESSTADYYVWVSLDPFTMVHEGGNAVALSRTGPVWEWHERTSNDSFRNSTSYTQSTFFLSCASVEFIGASSVSSDLDLTLDSVSDSLSGSAYSDWSASAQTIDEQQYFPVSIPSLSDSAAISTQTQAQAQAGTVPDSVADEIIAGADVVPETGTIADVITAVRALGADIVAAVQAIPAVIADIFSPAADPEVYQVDLKDFFPFCIPFDLFDIVTAFAAEPEAPVFEWPISVPRWGFEYTLKVDLQEWEDIASLFRTLELTIFCVGLAIVTREKFLRS